MKKILVLIIGIMVSDAVFGDWYCGDNHYLSGNNQCVSCPPGYYSYGADEPGDETDCWVVDDNGNRVYYPNTVGGNGGNGGSNGGGGESGGEGSGDVKDCDSGYWWNGSYCVQCPLGFNSSKTSAAKREDCYFTSGDTEKYYKTTYCGAGKYLPSNSTSCQTCPNYHICPGGYYVLYKNEEQGKYKCPTDYDMSDGDRSKFSDCYYTGVFGGKHHYNCGSGKWYNTAERRCKDCPSGYPKSAENKSIRPEQCFNNSHTANYKQKCQAGKYLPENKNVQTSCASCISGHVCPGDYFTSFTKFENQGLYKCANGYKKSGNACVVDNDNPTTCDSGQYKTGNGCEDCPQSFEYSAPNATKIEQCYARLDNDDKLYYKKVSCSAGQYLPKESGYKSLDANASNGCASCITTNNQKYCPGINNEYPSLNDIQGYENCPTGEVANSGFTACENSGGDNGGNGGNGGGTGGTGGTGGGGTLKCDAGQYLPAGLGRCKPCTATRKYCPGGTYQYPKSVDQGVLDCPTNALANTKHDGCYFKLSREMLKNGPNGAKTKFDNQCWAKNSTVAYAKCLFPNGVSSTSGGVPDNLEADVAPAYTGQDLD